MSHQAAVLAPAAVVAVLLLSRITIGTHTPAADRLVMVGALFGGAAGAASLLSYALNQARRWTSIVTCPLPTAWALLLGGIAAGQLSVLFGYKDVPFRESVWLFSVPSAVYYIVVSLSWVLALTAGREFLSRVFGNRHWPFYAAAFSSTALLLVLADAPALISPPRAQVAARPDLPSFRGSPNGGPLVLIGLDGLDSRVLARALATEDLPTLSRLADSGAAGTLWNGGRGHSPPIWTTIATGLPPSVHGIHGFETRRSPLLSAPLDVWWQQTPPGFGLKRIVAGLERVGLVTRRRTDGFDRVGPSIWQILSRFGYQVASLGYLVSAPAEQVNGVFLDVNAYASYEASVRDPRTAGHTSEYPKGTLARYGEEIQAEVASIEDEHQRGGAFMRELLLRLVGDQTFDFVTFVETWPDEYNHSMSASQLDRMLVGDFTGAFGKNFMRELRRTDRWLSRLLERLPNATLVLVSDHGVEPGFKFRQRVLWHAYSAHGFFLAGGPSLQPGARGRRDVEVSYCDIAPTVLAYFGLPPARDFCGQALSQLLVAPPRPGIPTYVTLIENKRNIGDVLDDRDTKRLRALGYIN